jgi:Domain of unknown function (DUF5086)
VGSRMGAPAMIGMAACLAAQVCAAYWSGKIASPLWSIRSDEGKVRWIEIHNLATAAADGVYHLEVMERMRADPPSQFRPLARHMAVTEAALRASLVEPLGKGSVYPESYDDAYARWKIAKAGNHAFVCKVSINACLAESPPN